MTSLDPRPFGHEPGTPPWYFGICAVLGALFTAIRCSGGGW